MKIIYALPILLLVTMSSCGQPVTELDIPLQGITNEPYSEEKEVFIQKVETNLHPYSKDSTEIARSIIDLMEFYKVAAVSIAVINNYRLDWAKAYGWADKESQIRATPQTLFQAASVSKSLNALGILNWAENNDVNLNADVKEYLKNWKFTDRKKANGKKISLASLLSHTAGLSVNGFDGYESDDRIPTIEQVLSGKNPANSKKVKSISEPDKEFKYSGGGIILSQMVLIENIDDLYDIYMKKMILDPLGMNKSTFTQPQSNDNEFATGYWIKGNPLTGKYHIYPEMAAAGLLD